MNLPKASQSLLAKPRTSLNIALDARYVQSGFPGIGRYVYSLAAAMATILDDGEGKLNLIYNPNLTDKRYDLPTLAAAHHKSVKLLTDTSKPISLSEQVRLPILAHSDKFQIWHAPYYIRPYFVGLPSVLTAYDVTSTRLPELLPSRKARLAFEVTTRLAFLTSKRIIVISQAAANDITRFYGVRPEKMTVIPLACDAHFQPLSSEEQKKFRHRLNLPQSYILYVGINKPHKNLKRLLEAFRQFKRQTNSSSVLIIAGREDKRYAEDLHLHAADLGLDLKNEVLFLGDVSEATLPQLYACADFFVLPSLYEGFGLPVLEAMASGCPVACSDNSSMPEVAGEAAVLFKAESVTEIAAALQKLAVNPLLRADLREKGLQRAKLFSWQRTAEATLEVYQGLC